jgi:hypothetical protein
MAIKIDRFEELLADGDDFEPIRIKTIIPKPTDGDYKVGYITRYFTQKANDNGSYIYEISERQFSSLLDTPFYKTVELDWKISGDRVEVMEMNRKSIRFASNDMKSIGLYLPNHLQFHKEIK